MFGDRVWETEAISSAIDLGLNTFVAGSAGSGKTSMLRHVQRRLDGYEAAVVYVNLEAAHSIGRALGSIAREVNPYSGARQSRFAIVEDETDLVVVEEAVAARVGTRPLVLLADGASVEVATVLFGRYRDRLWDRSPQVRCVVASRHRFPPPPADAFFDQLTPADFYVPAHRTVFEAMRRLYNDGQPIDTITVVDRLHRAGHLETVGGPGFVVGFWDAVPSAANVGYYIGVVTEHSLRRRMLDAARQITELATNLETDVDTALDQAEQTMLAVGETKNADSLETLSGLLSDVLERREHIETEGLDISGIPTGLADLDQKLGGLQPSTLVVVAGRPRHGQKRPSNEHRLPRSRQLWSRRLLQPRDVTHRNRPPIAGLRSQSRLHAATHRPHQQRQSGS